MILTLIGSGGCGGDSDVGRDAGALDGVPDLFVGDLGLPQMSGFQFLEWLQKQEVLKEIPVVVLSAFHNLDADLLSKLGASAYWRKPENISDWVRILQRTVDELVDNAGE